MLVGRAPRRPLRSRPFLLLQLRRRRTTDYNLFVGHKFCPNLVRNVTATVKRQDTMQTTTRMYRVRLMHVITVRGHRAGFPFRSLRLKPGDALVRRPSVCVRYSVRSEGTSAS